MRGYAICTTGRSGSNWLCEVLASTATLGVPLEYFNATARRKWTDPHYPDDPSEQLIRIVTTGATPNGVYGVKVFPNQIDQIANRTRWFDALPGLCFVSFTREDLLGRAISLARSVQTGRFRSKEAEVAEPRYDGAQIAGFVRYFARQDARWAAFFARNGITPVRLVYEQTVRDPQAAADRIADALGVPRAPVDLRDAGETIMRDALNDDWRRRFHAEFADPNVVEDI